MSRPPSQPKRRDVPESEHEAYDRVVNRLKGMMGVQDDPNEDFAVGEYFGALLNSPPMCAALAQIGTEVRTAGNRDNTYSHADREFVDQVLSYDWDYYGVLGVHTPDAIAVGVRLEAIEAIRDDREADLNDDERLLATFIRQVVSGTVSDDTYSSIEARLGTRGAVEYTIFIAFLQLTIRLFQALGVASPTRADVDKVIEEFKTSGRETTDFRDRIR
jgi:hypothetical protein